MVAPDRGILSGWSGAPRRKILGQHIMQLSRWLAVALAAMVLTASAAIPERAQAREIVGFSGGYMPGTIVVRTSARSLYYVLGNGRALRYPVGVGRIGKQWSGTSMIDGKYLRPAWTPPAEVRHDKPNLPNVIAGGSGRNPMGAAAMTLAGGQYAIHGTNNPGSIGGYVSYGCIRMYNEDVLDLYGRVGLGTTVIVTP
jgi:lipoprotein-anchoring transpeptidase ErfK/SrfK